MNPINSISASQSQLRSATSFKRLPIGAKFISQANGTIGQTFRKCGNSAAFKIKENGIGETHAKIAFSRSHAVLAQH